MKASGGKKHERRFSDIRTTPHSEGQKWLGWLRNRGRTVNLKPTFYKRYPFLVFLAAVLLAASFFAVRNISTRAEVADFYASTCLGTWQNPSDAQGEPENMISVGAPAIFDEANSAILTPPAIGQIYCGGFVSPDFSAGGARLPDGQGSAFGGKSEGDVNSVGLTLVWQVEFNGSTPLTTGGNGGTEAAQPPAANESNQSGAGEATTTLPADGATNTDSIVPSAGENTLPVEPTAPVPTSPEQSRGSGTEVRSTTQSSFFRNFRYILISPIGLIRPISTAFAQESASAPVADVPVVEPAPDPLPAGSAGNVQPSADSVSETAIPAAETAQDTASTTETVILGPPLRAELNQVVSSAESIDVATGTASGTQTSENIGVLPTIEPAPPDENFLIVSYSADGQTWSELAKVNKDNWKNLTFSLPAKNWAELAKMQIRIESIPTTADVRRVYLDGMFVEVHYEVVSSVGLEFLSGDKNSSSTPATPVGPSLDGAPNPFPGLPQVILPKSGDAGTQRRNWSGKESPIIDIDINGLPSALGLPTPPAELSAVPASTTLGAVGTEPPVPSSSPSGQSVVSSSSPAVPVPSNIEGSGVEPSSTSATGTTTLPSASGTEPLPPAVSPSSSVSPAVSTSTTLGAGGAEPSSTQT